MIENPQNNKSIITTSEFICCILMCLPFCEMEGLIAFGVNWDLYTSCHCIILIFATVFINHRVNKLCLLYGAYFCVVLLGTFINNPGNSYVAIYYGGRMISYIILFDYYCHQKRLYLLLLTLKNILGIQILITFIFQFVAQGFFGLTVSRNYVNFLTPDNSLGYRYISFTLIAYLVDFQGHKKKWTDFVFWVGICLLSLLRAWAVAGIIGYVVFVTFLFLLQRRITSYLTPFISWWAIFGVTLAMTFFHVQNSFSFIINNIFSKAYSFSVRESIWKSAINNILAKPILGYGTDVSGRVLINYSEVNGLTYFSHNVYFEILIQGGLVGFLFVSLIYWFASRQIKKENDHTDIVCAIEVAVFAILLMQTSEWAFYDPLANLPLILCFMIGNLVDDTKLYSIKIM